MEISKNISSGVQSYWDNMSEEEKSKMLKDRNEKFRKSIKSHYDNMTDDERKLDSERRSKIRKEWLTSLTADEYVEYITHISDKLKEYWENLPEDEKEFRIIQNKNAYNNLSDVEKDRLSKEQSERWLNSSDEYKRNRNEKLSNSLKEYNKNLTEEEKLKRSITTKQQWENLTEEERNDLLEKFSKGQKRRYENSTKEEMLEIYYNKAIRSNNDNSFILNKLEIELNNKFRENNFNIKPQYYNIEKHSNWDELFPYNKVTGGKFVSPYHCWDFLIKTKKKNILVDIDGSVHDPTKMQFKLFGNDYTVEDVIQFNDSQRPYQTDGLEAYIIKCYDDTLSDDTEVVSVNDDSMKLTFKQFISYLILMNV